MSFVRLHKLITYVYASIGLYVVAATADVSLGVSLLTAALVVASVFAEGPRIATPGYQRLHTVVLLGVVGLEAVPVLRGEPLFPVLVELTMALGVSRLAQRRTATEHKQIAAIALLHLLIGTIVDTGLTYAGAFVAFLVITPWMMALTHLRGEIEKKYGALRAEDGAVASTAAHTRVLAALRSRELATPRFLLGSAALSLPLFLVTALFFLIFPRVGSGFLDVRARETGSTAGFGDRISLGGFGTIRDDPTVVIRIYPPNLGDDAPPSRLFRLRGTSFDTYDGRTWTHGTRASEQLRSYTGLHVLARQPHPDADEKLRIQAEPLDGPLVFLPEGTVAVRFSTPYVNGVPEARSAAILDGFEVRLTDVTVPSVVYDAYVGGPHEALDTKLDEATRVRALAVPPGHERVAALARRVTQGATTDGERVTRLVAFLRTRYAYSLEQNPGTAQMPLVAFLFETKRGHCEYFSTALAIMLRTLGIPARNVTGFLGGERNAYASFYGIRQGDAHSWVEAFVDGAFRTYDPTPPAREAFTVHGDALTFLRDGIDALRARWASDIIGFDFDRQTELFRSLRGASSSRVYRTTRDAPPRARGRFPWLPLVVALGAGGAVYAFTRFLRVRPARLPEVVRLYAQLDRALARRGHARPISRTPRAHLEALEAAGFAPIDVVREITELYARARYEDVAVSREALRALARRVSAISRRR